MYESSPKISIVMSIKLDRNNIIYTEYYIVLIFMQMNNIIVSINFTSILEVESVIIPVSSILPDGPLSKYYNKN